MTSTRSQDCPFAVGSKITDRKSFIGRRDEIDFIISHMQGDQPCSVSIVGDRMIGKSSLLYHIFQIYEERVNNANQFVVIYLSLQQSDCRDQASFYKAVANALLQLSKVQIHPELAEPLRVVPFDGIAFKQMLQVWKAAGVLPVICLDDFEELLDRTDRFNNDFYDNLRALIGDRVVMFVIAARQRFNVFQNSRLQELSEDEARDLVHLPHRDHPALGEEKRSLALKWGEQRPYLLQIAGRCLWEAKQGDRSEEWARQQFEERSMGVPRKFQPVKQSIRAIMRLGSWGQGIGNTLDDWGNFFKGMFTLLLIVLCLTGIVRWQQVKQWFQNIQEETTQQNFK